MKTKQRIKQLEDLKLNTGRVVLWWDIEDRLTALEAAQNDKR